jgi:hypothetical protein
MPFCPFADIKEMGVHMWDPYHSFDNTIPTYAII